MNGLKKNIRHFQYGFFEKIEIPRISQKDAVFGENLRWKTQ